MPFYDLYFSIYFCSIKFFFFLGNYTLLMQGREKMLLQMGLWEVDLNRLQIIFNLRSVFVNSNFCIFYSQYSYPVCPSHVLMLFFFKSSSSDCFLWDRQYTCNERESSPAKRLLGYSWDNLIRWNVIIFGMQSIPSENFPFLM